MKPTGFGLCESCDPKPTGFGLCESCDPKPQSRSQKVVHMAEANDASKRDRYENIWCESFHTLSKVFAGTTQLIT